MTSDERILAVDAMTVGLDDLELPDEDVLSGSPAASIAELDDIDGVEIGIWELTEGIVRDIEIDEVFIVLAGSATITFGDGTSLRLRPGMIVRLHDGDHTTWEVHKTLRKVYIS